MSPAAPSVWPKQDLTHTNLMRVFSTPCIPSTALNAWPRALTSIGSPNGVPAHTVHPLSLIFVLGMALTNTKQEVNRNASYQSHAQQWLIYCLGEALLPPLHCQRVCFEPVHLEL